LLGSRLSPFSFHPSPHHHTPFPSSLSLRHYHQVGNSGMFRPEMLRPMGMPEDVNVIAWGLSLERPTMILYGIDNIRDLFGHKVSLSMVKKNPICRLGV
jgi:phenylalanyl-tRNA synthetase alpha chain